MTKAEKEAFDLASYQINLIHHRGGSTPWETALKLSLASFGPNHPQTAYIRLSLADQLIELRRYSDAEHEIGLAEKTFDGLAEPGHPLRIVALQSHRFLLNRQQRTREQIAIIERILSELDIGSADSPLRQADMTRWRGTIAALKGDYRAAEPLYRKYYEGQPAANLAGRASAADLLANLLMDMGRDREAAMLIAPLIAEARKDEKANARALADLLETDGQIAENQFQFFRSDAALTKAREIRQDDAFLNPKLASATRTAVSIARQRRFEDRFDAPFGSFAGPDSYTSRLSLEEAPKIADGLDAQVATAIADVEEAGQSSSPNTLTLRKDILSWYEKAFGPGHPTTARARRELATALLETGKPYSAEQEIQRSLIDQRRALAEPNDEIGRSLLVLGRAYLSQGRRTEALAAFEQALRNFDIAGLPPHYWTRETLNLIAGTANILNDRGRAGRAFERFAALGAPATDEISTPLIRQLIAFMQVGVTYMAQEKQCLPPQTRREFAKNLDTMRTLTPMTSNAVDNGFYMLAEAEACAGNFDAAADAIARVEANPFHLMSEYAPRAAAATALRKARLVRAFMADDKRMKSASIETAKAGPGVVGARPYQSSQDIGWELDRAENVVRGLLDGAMGSSADLDSIRARSQLEAGGRSLFDVVFATRLDFDWRVHELQQGPGPVTGTYFDAGKIANAITAAQDMERASSAQMLAQASARLTAGNTAMGALLRRREQLSTEQRRIAAALAQATVAGAAAGPNAASAETLRGQSSALVGELAAIDTKLQKDYPDYFGLTHPKSLTTSEIIDKLAPGEALLVVRPNGDDVHVFVVTKEKVAWNKLTGAAPEVAALVNALRCDIDAATCGKDAGGGNRGASRGPPRLRASEAGDPAGGSDWLAPGFDRQKAWRLYEMIFAPVAKAFAKEFASDEDITRLYTVISGPLAALPLGTLVTSKPTGDTATSRGTALLDTPWLADRFTLIGLPSVSSLALKPPPAASTGLAVVGYGDPTLGIRESQEERFASFLKTVTLSDEGMRALPKALRALDALPGTRAELEAISGLFGADKAAVRLQDAATESAVKSDPSLPKARIIIFSTHGLLPGEVEGNVEPGLVFTPPAQASDRDDGLLTASEAATLSLDADLLVLSACNTATTDGTPGAESLSSLSRAFLYAGTRGIYASHWRVSDEVTSRLMLIAIGLRRDGRTRAEALAGAMRAVRTGKLPDGAPVPKWTPDWAHPAAWAPFVIISGNDN